MKDLPSKLTAEAYTQSIEQADSLPAQAEGESDDDEIREVRVTAHVRTALQNVFVTIMWVLLLVVRWCRRLMSP